MLAGVILLAVTHMCGYLPNDDPNNLPINWTRITTFIPAWVWVIGWAATLVMSFVNLFRGRGRLGIGLGVAMCCASAAAYLASYIITVLIVGWGSREWFYFGVYLAVALIVTGLLAKVGALKQEEQHTDE